MARSCACAACQSLCQHEPGWFVPEEIDGAAAYLGISRYTLEHDYLTAHAVPDGVALAPRTKPGTTECIFFETGKCRIHPVKPYECRKVFGCESGRRHKRMRELIARRWR
ncbi:MAG: hypothetical protein HY696_00080 [Deltaproteobacteria bacterium]|nr:hypothetical protein [Deltaproteobacteria bacterium]